MAVDVVTLVDDTFDIGCPNVLGDAYAKVLAAAATAATLAYELWT